MNNAKPHFTCRLRWILTSLCVSFTLLMTPASAEIYKWTDASGEIQYSQTPPPNGIKSDKIQGSKDPMVGSDSSPDSLQEQVDAMDEDIAEQEIEEKKQDLQKQIDDAYERNCITSTNNLEKLQQGGSKRYLTPDGKVTHLTDEQRQQRINEAKDQMDEFCK